ncbi:PilZ domain [Syntrophomonas zehnderi OL-4]|uniref:PilZ domain n=1 Tax=Syntrophomonas zehnderi OL-4 TaxID=690567 RepID=A0A0E3W3A0_9FIRM|nr:flagellar brake protein [Syntrophomonas zehnderi]CFX66012.1 PilZ domain [Syntrophomonas zehnderi OL-4]
MQASELKVNQRIEITVDEEGTEYKNLPSRIEEVTDQHLYIAIPMKWGQLIPVRVRQKLIVSFNQQGRFFQFETVIMHRHLKPIPMLAVLKPDSIREIQRRQWVRVPVSIPLKFGLLNEDESTTVHETTTVDISGGGVCFLTRNPLAAGQLLDAEIDLPNREPVYCQLKVLRVLETKTEGSVNKAFSEYYDISESQRERIIAYVFEKQREWIKKGLI